MKEGITKKTASSLTQDRWLQAFIKFVRIYNLLQANDKVIVAVSGGLDSTVLAHLMVRAARILSFHVEFVHVDHGTRGLASTREGLWVKSLADRLAVKSHLTQVLGLGTGKSQAELRDARRASIELLAGNVGANKIATAHHGDDNAETFLMRAISGTGTSGLGSMSPQEGIYIKPLLWATREELEKYAREHRLAWIEDPSNAKSVYLRNQVRSQIFPALEQIRPGAMKNMARLAERIAEEEDELLSWLEPQFEGPTETLPRAFVEKFPEVIQRRIFKIWLRRLQLEVDPALVESLIAGQEIVHASGTFIRRADFYLFIPETGFGKIWQMPLPVGLGIRVGLGVSTAWSFLPSASRKLASLRLDLYFRFCPADQAAKSNELRLAWDQLPWPLMIRARSDHDPKRELDDILSRHKIPRPFWKNWPLLVAVEDPSAIIALVGVEVRKKYSLDRAGRCVSMESFYTDSLRSDS